MARKTPFIQHEWAPFIASRQEVEILRYAWPGHIEDMPWEIRQELQRWLGSEAAEEAINEAPGRTVLTLLMAGRPQVRVVTGLTYVESTRRLHEAEGKGKYRILTQGSRVFAVLMALSILALAVAPPIGMAGIFVALGLLSFYGYAFWLDQRVAILNPKFMAISIVACLGLAMTALVTLSLVQ